VCQTWKICYIGFFFSCLAYLEIGFVLLLSHQKIFQYCGQADKYFSLVRCSCLPSTLDGLRYIHTVYANKKGDLNKKTTLVLAGVHIYCICLTLTSLQTIFHLCISRKIQPSLTSTVISTKYFQNRIIIFFREVQ